MAETHESLEIKETDIVFDCPHCGKSLAIDYRGAGLSIPCTDCGKSVIVPIPEGMELSDMDATSEDKEGIILNLRKTLAATEVKIQNLESQIKELHAKREALEAVRSTQIYQFGAILEKVSVAQRALEEVAVILSKATS